MEILYERTKEALKKAREKYGYQNQVLIAIEELNELSCVLAKYPRFETHMSAVDGLREHVLEECADVVNVLDHVQAIFGINDTEIVECAGKKGDRLSHWLLKDETQNITTKDREIPEKPCPLCMNNGSDPFSMPCIVCHTKHGYKGFLLKDSSKE